jgi:hypothetical protein
MWVAVSVAIGLAVVAVSGQFWEMGADGAFLHGGVFGGRLVIRGSAHPYFKMGLKVQLREDMALPVRLPISWGYWNATDDWAVSVPAWFPPLPILAFGGLACWMSRSNARGCCTVCGYNLAGLPPGPSGAVVCPECSRVH